jgi:hypothetical protein
MSNMAPEVIEITEDDTETLNPFREFARQIVGMEAKNKRLRKRAARLRAEADSLEAEASDNDATIETIGAILKGS